MKRRDVLAAGLLGTALAAGARTSLQAAEPPRFNSPDEAVTYFVDALKRNDAAAMLAAFSGEEQVGRRDFRAFLNRYKSFSIVSPWPSSQTLYAELERKSLVGDAVRQIKRLIAGFLAADNAPMRDLAAGKTILFSDDSDGTSAQKMAEFEASFDPAVLSDLKVLKIAQPGHKMTATARYKENKAGRAKVEGWADAEDRVVLYEFHGKLMMNAFGLENYGQGWSIGRLIAITAPLGLGEVRQVTQQDFDALIE